jgi:uncharacterized damage-inducible protein DinB
MESYREQLKDMMAIREKAIAALRELPDSALKIAHPESKRTVRQMVSLYFSHERNHIVQLAKTRNAIGSHPTEVELLLAQAMQSRGDLLSTLIGVTDAQWDQKPSEDAWSIREILTHMIEVENRLLTGITELVKSHNG